MPSQQIFGVNESQELYENKEIQDAISNYFDKYPLKQSDVNELLQLKQEKVPKVEQPNQSVASKSKSEERPKSRERVFTNSNPNLAALFASHTSAQFNYDIPTPPRPSTSFSFRRYQEGLPTWKLRAEILEAINANAVTLITGGTGCGKTTQIPQFLLDDAARSKKPMRVFCTQPRRLPAIAISKRVARERGEQLGQTVGYHIRLERKISPECSLIYLTSGVLLRKLTVDELAREATHIILDEIHERELNTDYLLILLRQAFQKRKDLKLILMSATMEGNIEMFHRYFEGFGVGHINVPSLLYPVETFHLPEVLALTGYMPKSACGIFDHNALQMQSADEFGNAGFGTFRPMPTRGRGSNSQRAMLSAMFRHCHQQNSRQNVNNESDVKFIRALNEQQNQNPFGNGNVDAREHCRKLLPGRPNYFDQEYLPRFHRTHSKLPLDALINGYLEAGGGQWCDSVDVELVVEVIRFLMDSPKPGAILVFLPGFDDIQMCAESVMKLWDDRMGGIRMIRTKPIIYCLHSQMNTTSQQNVFEHITSPDQRKVVLSTNIAEASLTIDDVVFVIDCGKAKVKEYDYDSRVARLLCQWIAKSNAEQRKGRAGRCQPGFCFRLFTKENYDKMRDTQMPEIKRVAIYDVCLNAKMFAPHGVKVIDFLKNAPDPPEEQAVVRSMQFLEQIGALYSPYNPMYNCFEPGDPDITQLGKYIAQLPLDPQMSRLLLFGLALKCLNPIITLVAAVSHRDPFILSMAEEERQMALHVRNELSGTDYSDHLLLIRLMFRFENESNEWIQGHFCAKHFVSQTAMLMIRGIKEQIFYELKRLNLLPAGVTQPNDPKVNKYSGSWPMVQAAIVAGTYPNVGYVGAGVRFNRIRSTVGKNSYFHASSSLRRQIPQSNKNRSEDDPLLEYFVFQEAIDTNDDAQSQKEHALRIVSAIPQLTIALFAGPIRMSTRMIEHFELVDVDGSKRQKRREREEEKARKWKEEREEDVRLWNEAQLARRRNRGENDGMDEATFGRGPDLQMPLWLKEETLFELDDCLSFRGQFDALQSISRLNFRLMLYFTRFIKNPGHHLSKEDRELLGCTNTVLISAHKNSKFTPVRDLPAPRSEFVNSGHSHQHGAKSNFRSNQHQHKRN